ncbi:MAG TPA: hypothetical protein VIV61_01800 [Candidatus Ozemobacteraceae bacterium]
MSDSRYRRPCPPRGPIPILAVILLLFGLPVVLEAAWGASDLGPIRSVVPSGWTLEGELPNGGFKVSRKWVRTSQGQPGLGCEGSVVVGWSDKPFDVQTPDGIPASLRRTFPLFSVLRPYSIDGFTGYILFNRLEFRGGSWDDGGYRSSEYFEEGHGYLMSGPACIRIIFRAGAGGDYSNSNKTEVVALGDEIIGQAHAVLAGLRITWTPPGGTPTTPPAPVSKDAQAPEWQTVTGTGALGLLLVFIAGLALIKKAGSRVTPDQPAGYVLQLSAQQIDVDPMTSAKLQITAWRIMGDASRYPATEAVISLAFQPPIPALSVTPDAGTGQLRCEITLDRLPESGTLATTLVVTARAGAATTSASVRIGLGMQLGAWASGLAEAEVVFDKVRHMWVLPPITAFFLDSRGAQARPPGPWRFQDPPVVADREILEIETVSGTLAGMDQGTIALRLRPDVDLLRDATLQPWLLGDGRVNLEIRAETQEELPRCFSARVTLRFRPTVERCAWSYHGAIENRGERPYRGLTLAQLELAADGADILHLAVAFRRTDAPETPLEPAEYVELERIELEGGDAAQFALEPDRSVPPLPGRGTWKIESLRPLLYTKERAERSLIARLTARLRPEARNVRLLPDPADIPLEPRAIALTPWVVAGQRPGTADAVALVCLPPHIKRAMSGVPVTVRVENLGHGSLRPLTGDAVRTGPDGLTGKCVLRYEGLSWANVSDARFRVKFGIPDRHGTIHEAVFTDVDVGRNLMNMLTELETEAGNGELEFENPLFDRNSAQFMGDTSWKMFGTLPEIFRGPAQNMLNMMFEKTALGTPAAIAASTEECQALAGLTGRFVCGSYRARIRAWLERRRFGSPRGDETPIPFVPERMARYNGIEIGEYTMGMLATWPHLFAGIYLAGMSPAQDPRFIDPWWRQTWTNAGSGLRCLFTAADEVERLGMVAESLMLIASVAAKVGTGLAGAVAGTAVASLTKWLLGSGLVTLVQTGIGYGTIGEDTSNNVIVRDGGDELYSGYTATWPQKALQHLTSVKPQVKPCESVSAWERTA